ncbi:hypothetical protein SLS54_008188 [Diplodia seriata]
MTFKMKTAGEAGVLSHTHFLQRDDLYIEEKPYSLRYTPPEGSSRANIKLELHEIRVRDVRPVKDKLSFETDGCAIVDLGSRMKYEDWDDDSQVKAVYLREVADLLRRVLDTTVPWVLDMVRSLNPETAEEILKHRIQCVNVWKPLIGPVRDWPLAMCDPQSVNVDQDLEPCDLVYPDYVVENQQVYFSDAFEWAYLSDQQPNEAWIFLQSDTDPDGKPGMIFSAFDGYD